MIQARQSLLRQAQQYFHMLLLGHVKWDDVIVDKAIPVPPIKGNRDQGKVKDLVIAHFDGFRMELMSPFESDKWPLGRVAVSRGAETVEGPLDALTWMNVAKFVIDQKELGETDGRIASGEDWGR